MPSGYPLASIPFNYVETSGRPYGLHVIAKANEEDKIIKFMSVWEKIIGPRRTPDLMRYESFRREIKQSLVGYVRKPSFKLHIKVQR